MDKTSIHFWPKLRELIRARSEYEHPEAIQCAGGEVTRQYLDLKGLFTNYEQIGPLSEAICNYLWKLRITDANCIGGPTMGADFISHAVAFNDDRFHWFSVRDEPKDHGLQRLIEGARLDESHRILLVDDVVSTGKSLLRAYDAVWETGAQILAVMPIVDRAGIAETSFLERGVPYHPLFTHHELGIDPL